MTSVKDKTDKLVEYIDEAKKIGIEVLPPDVNESLVDFAVVGERHSLRLGRDQGRRRRRGAQRSSTARERDGTFHRSLRPRAAGRRETRQPASFRSADQVRRARRPSRKPRAEARGAGCGARAGGADDARRRTGPSLALRRRDAHRTPTLAPKLPSVAAPTTREMLAWERETLGIFVSGHPLAELAPCWREPARCRSKTCASLPTTRRSPLPASSRRAPHADEIRTADPDRATRGHDRRLRRRALLEDVSAVAAPL